jgi:hypothetical protein
MCVFGRLQEQYRGSRGSSGDIVTGFGLDNHLYSVPCSHRARDSCRALFRGKCGRGVELYLHSPIRFHGVVLNYLSFAFSSGLEN